MVIGSREDAKRLHPGELEHVARVRLMDLSLGLLMDFGQPLFKDGLKRIVNNHRGGKFGA